VAAEILESAGITRARRVELTRKRVRVLDEAMDATKVERITFEGAVMSTHDDVDHRTRLAAGDAWDEIQGLKRSKSANDKGPSGPLTINVIIEHAEVPRVEVIEVQAP